MKNWKTPIFFIIDFFATLQRYSNKIMNNPYEKTLDGLIIDDPVKSFFDWCKERENIRIKRENGEKPPWTSDPIFQQGRFLNTFREDDKGSKAVLQFCDPVKSSLKELIHALFFARWCNQQTTLNRLTLSDLKNPSSLKDLLLNQMDQPWSSEAYPVVPVHWDGIKYERLEACTELFPNIINFLLDNILASNRNVVTATNLINQTFQMTNDFPIFMTVIDISWFRPDIISPESPVPTGIGAKPYLDRLQNHLDLENHHATIKKMISLQGEYWPSIRRQLTPVDVEYISCENRKYFSYKNGTKLFEGKNLFITNE
ncbi:MAG TPA: hypothetical protein EYO06_03940 [Candidatus Marinimicrobia bacterium]|jgi:hypothetical protein|nr:hypothetical protein [Candidatus Neomarinimicrobiota bacterium]HIB80112.1 hypothetical protein [Candidatus Neomarinimicrobiota bacterium]